ncbi:LytR/AlgR family response regulator transcription factor [Larkinella knui]|uniref:LytTR family transcriptional regulator n=1 Tax=Larkinella knui TaxID=2025310 RepID=A0A3P1CEZ9_9BACT|nr:LytTR family DNA-binding domain-containing protein [Larkinella knui]RRB11899.1 LytTR family transcriptional regulator [Larkinella knui]
MDKQLTLKFNSIDRNMSRRMLVGSVVVVTLIITQDFLRASLNNSAFYFSESFLFSTFWWLFAPFLLAQYTLVKRTKSRPAHFQWLAIILPFTIHLFAFPVLVWVLSKTFYYHTFTIQQTLQYTLAEQSYLLVIIYLTPVLVYPYYGEKTKAGVNKITATPDAGSFQLIQSFLVSDGGKKRAIPIQEIVYFSAVSPYIGIHTDERKYLYTETLKSIATRLPVHQFVRVHKSTIVNINQVESYTSRLNGDYDLTLKNKGTLRVSRNFAAEFKRRFHQSHQLTSIYPPLTPFQVDD